MINLLVAGIVWVIVVVVTEKVFQDKMRKRRLHDQELLRTVITSIEKEKEMPKVLGGSDD